MSRLACILTILILLLIETIIITICNLVRRPERII